jgi:hypothetical protein
MKKILILTFIVYKLLNPLLAQQEDTIPKKSIHLKNNQFSIYVEAFGNGGLFSANIDYVFYGDRNVHLAVRGGIGGPFKSELCFPGELSLIIGRNKYFVETGFGMTFLYYGNIINVLRLGFRFQNYPKGLLFRLGVTPYSIVDPDLTQMKYKLSAGASVGFAF